MQPNLNSQSSKRLRVFGVAICSLLVTFGIVGCKKAENHDDISRVQEVNIKCDTPTETAQSCIELLLLDVELAPKAGTKLESVFYEKAMEFIAVDDIFAQHRSAYPKNLYGKELLRAQNEVVGTVFRSWASTIAYYQSQIDVSQLTELQQPGGKSLVYLPLDGPDGKLYARLYCAAQPGEETTWRVVNLEVTTKGPPQATLIVPMAPTTQPNQ